MKFICPVAKCHEKVSPENYYSHVLEYEEEHKDNPVLMKSHGRFANYFFPNIWNSDMAIKKKWRMIAQPSSTAGTTAGTVQPYVIEYGTNYKKMIFQFSGYENDSTTDQTIDYPLAFASYAGISLNTTGLTISTTTYSGILIIEGY